MRSYILFNLKRHFLSKTSILTNTIIALLIIAFFFIDVFIEIDNHQIVYLDTSAQVYLPALQELQSDINYEILSKDKQDIIILKYDGDFILECDDKIVDETVASIKSDLTKLALNYYQQQQAKSLYNELIVNDGSRNIDSITYLITFIYIMIISLAFMLANEIVNEKNSHILEMLLTNISTQQHLIAKIIGSYIDMFLQAALLLFQCFIAYLMRYTYDKANGLKKVFAILFAQQQYEEISSINIANIIFIFLISSSCLVLIQIIILFISSYFNNVQQIASFNTLIYVLMLIIYVVCLNIVDQQMLSNEITKVISLLPLCNVVLLNCRLVTQQVAILEIVISLFLNILSSIMIVKIMTNRYKENILNFHL